MRKINLPAVFPETATHDAVFRESGNGLTGNQTLLAALGQRFQQYDALAPFAVAPPAAAPVLAQNGAKLYKLYDSKCKTAIKVKDAVDSLAGACARCPLCGCTDPPTTRDHFLPRAEFQEYSLYPPNLVPACWSCNVPKGTAAWDPATGARLFLNPYYDQFMAVEFVRLKILPDVGDATSYEVPLFQFEFDAPNMTAAQRDTCVRHFAFRTGAILRDYCRDELNVLRRQHRPSVVAGSLTPAALRATLLALAQAKATVYGDNCWESIFARGVANDANLLGFVVTKPI